MEWGRLNGPDRLELEDGRQMRLLSAFEVLQARAEARELTGEDREMALCANACLLAKVVLQDGVRAFRDGAQVLEQMTVEEIERLAGLWAGFNRRVNPGVKVDQAEVNRLKKAWSTPGRSGCTGACCEPFRPCQRRNGSGT